MHRGCMFEQRDTSQLPWNRNILQEIRGITLTNIRKNSGYSVFLWLKPLHQVAELLKENKQRLASFHPALWQWLPLGTAELRDAPDIQEFQQKVITQCLRVEQIYKVGLFFKLRNKRGISCEVLNISLWRVAAAEPRRADVQKKRRELKRWWAQSKAGACFHMHGAGSHGCFQLLRHKSGTFDNLERTLHLYTGRPVSWNFLSFSAAFAALARV